MTSPVRAYPLTRRRPINYSLRQLFRPSIRLKTTLYILSLIIFVLVVLALNAGAQLSRAPVPKTSSISKSAINDSLADTGAGKEVAKGQDAHLIAGIEGQIQRSFEEPDYALLSGKQPSLVGCDVPLQSLGLASSEDDGVMLFLGIFSSASRRERRDMYVFFNQRPRGQELISDVGTAAW